MSLTGRCPGLVVWRALPCSLPKHNGSSLGCLQSDGVFGGAAGWCAAVTRSSHGLCHLRSEIIGKEETAGFVCLFGLNMWSVQWSVVKWKMLVEKHWRKKTVPGEESSVPQYKINRSQISSKPLGSFKPDFLQILEKPLCVIPKSPLGSRAARHKPVCIRTSYQIAALPRHSDLPWSSTWCWLSTVLSTPPGSSCNTGSKSSSEHPQKTDFGTRHLPALVQVMLQKWTINSKKHFVFQKTSMVFKYTQQRLSAFFLFHIFNRI